MRAVRVLPCLATAALAFGACAPAPGLVLDVELGSFRGTAAEVRVTLHAPHGFMQVQPDSNNGPGFSQMDVDGDGTRDLVIRFLTPFPAKEHVLVATKNAAEIAIHADAVAFDADKVIAGATGDATLPGGGHGLLSLTLVAQAPGVVGPTTNSTDLLTDTAKVALRGPAAGVGVSSIAACALDGVGGRNDLVIGVPNLDQDATRTGAGAVFVVLNVGATASVDLKTDDSSQLSFFGAEGGDHLGTAVACADTDADGLDDVIVGAPGAANGAGRVYAIKGQQAMNTRSVDLNPLTATSTNRPNATWGPGVDTPDPKVPGFGTAIFAFDFDGDGKAEILVAAPSFKKVHLLPPAASAGLPTDVERADHPIFTDVTATSLAAGDFDGTKTGVDVVIGDPSFVPANDVLARGAAFVFANVALKGSAATAATAATTTIVGNGGGFGKAILALNTTGHGQDLLVGAPSGADGHGLIYLYPNDSHFFLAPMRDFMKTAKGAPLDLGETNGAFGSALAACANGTTTFGLAVGAPETAHGARDATGAAYVLGTGGAFPAIERLYGAGAKDRLGSAVACGDFNDDKTGDLVTVAPNATGVGAGAGAVYVLETHTSK